MSCSNASVKGEEAAMSEENKPVEQKDAAQTEQELAKKRNAFLRYMTIVFAVAFLLVLISLVLQMHTAKTAMSDLKESNSSALTNAAVNAELLQDDNRKLQEEVDTLKEQLSAAEQKLSEQSDSIAELEAELEQARDSDSELAAEQRAREETVQAYDALLTALRCTTHEGNVTFSKAIGTVEKYKDRLSETALAVYEGLLEE